MRIFFYFILFYLQKFAIGKLPCLKSVDKSILPFCEIKDHLKDEIEGQTLPTYECLKQWENSIYLSKDGEITLDCTAPFPLELDYNGVKPIKNLQIEYYKKKRDESEGNQLAFDYGIRVPISAKNLEFSGDYIFKHLGNPSNESQITIFVFAEKADLPQFLNYNGKTTLDAFLDPTNPNYLILPCRSANFNVSHLQLYFDYEDIRETLSEDDLRYDPRKGFILRIPNEDEDRDSIWGTYECHTQWKTPSTNDRIKVRARNPNPDSFEEEEEEYLTSAEKLQLIMHEIHGLIQLVKDENHDLNGICTLPVNLANEHPHSIFFAVAAMDNPTSSKLNTKCSHPDSSCGDHVRTLTTKTETENNNVLELSKIANSGLAQCSVGANTEQIEYFRGADENIYFDWNDALAKNALVNIKPSENYSVFTPYQNYSFNCERASYVTVEPIWWTFKYKNGSKFNHLDEGKTGTFFLNLDLVEISCGVSLWNESNWYRSSIPISVLDVKMPIFSKENRLVTFQKDEKDQSISCELDSDVGSSDVQLEWLQNGKKIEGLTQTRENANKLKLHFPTMEEKYSGNYTCRAIASSGHFVEAKYQIFVEAEQNPEEESSAEKTSSSENNESCQNLKFERMNTQLKFFVDGQEQEITPDSLNSLPTDRIVHLNVYTTYEELPERPDCIFLPTNSTLMVKVLSPDIEYSFNTTDIAETVELIKEEHDTSLDKGNEQSDENNSINELNQIDPRQRWFPLHSILPFLLGLAIVVLVGICALATYSYYVSPWKIRRISTVSREPLI